jgi:uncharacterized protein with beta-barrel porin domain
VGGSFDALIAALSGTSDDTLGAFLDQLSPQSLQIWREIAFDNATFTTLDVNNHLASLRDGLTGFDSSQISVNDPTLSPTLSHVNSRLADMKDMKDMKEMAPAAIAPQPADPWSLWIAGQVILADYSSSDANDCGNKDLFHQDYTTGSVILGLDYRLNDNFTLGVLGGYNHTDATLDNIGSSTTVDTYLAGLYGSYVDGGWYGNFLGYYAYNSYTEDRNLSIGDFAGTNSGATDGDEYVGSLTGGYEFRNGDFKYGPIAGVQFVDLEINSFSEDGPTALNVDSQSAQSFRSQLGVEGRYAARAGSVVLVPHASASWQHEFLDNSSPITSQFSQIGGASTFTVWTTTPDRDSAVLDVGLNAVLSHDVTLFTDYEAQVAGNFFAQSVEAGVEISF